MKCTGKIRISSLAICTSSLGLGILAERLSAQGSFSPLSAVILVAAIGAAGLVGSLIGRSIDKRLGAEPEEIEKIASELATGYLASGREYGSKGAASALGLAIDQLSEVFRATRRVSRSSIDIVHKIRINAFLAGKREAEREVRLAEIERQADELSLQTQELYKAIDFYSFSLEPKAPTSIATAKQEREIEADLSSMLGLERPKETRKPFFGSRPTLTLLPRPEHRGGFASSFVRAWTRPQLKLLHFDDQDRQAE